jgi:ATP-dependent 26S proteasome regulatory subunit
MSLKRVWLVVLLLTLVLPLSPSGDVDKLFRARNDTAIVYSWAKDSAREAIRGILACACILGAFKYFRSTKRVDRLIAFVEAGSLGTMVYTILGFARKILLNPLARMFPSVVAQRRLKKAHTESLLNALEVHDIQTEDQLPSEEHIHTKTDKKMLERMRAAIGYGGLEAESNWVDKLMVTQEPDHIGDIPHEALRFIKYINDPESYQRLGATLGRGLLLTGNPGCGKTTLARRIAYLTRCPLIETSCSSMANKYKGTGPNAIKRVFATACSAAHVLHRKEIEAHQKKHIRFRYIRSLISRFMRLFYKRKPVPYHTEFMKPTILCLNEVDSILGERREQHGEHVEDLRMLTEFLNSFDNSHGVFVIGTTNEEGSYFDRAVLRPGRLGVPVAVPLPDASCRYKILAYYMNKLKSVAEDVALQRTDVDLSHEYTDQVSADSVGAFWGDIIRRTEGFSGDELRHIINEAALRAADKDASRVTRQDIQESLEDYLGKLHEHRRISHPQGAVSCVANSTNIHATTVLVDTDTARSQDDHSYTFDEEYPGEF